jgi:hypothetical protein
MQFSKIAFAVAAVCAASAATAAPNAGNIALSAGASAVQNNVRLAVLSLCKAPNVSSSYVIGNFTTVVCADVALGAAPSALYLSKPDSEFKFFDGLPFKEIRFNVSNGSFGSVQILNSPDSTSPFYNPAVSPANPIFTFRNPGTAVNTDATPGAVIIGGISDTETNRFPSSTIGANTLYANGKLGAAQIFGVAASTALYTKMFDAQQAAGLIPAAPTCTVASTGTSYCIPSISKAQMATIMSSNDTNAAYSKGLGFLTTAADDGTELRYVRRVDTSGTQSSAQNYFLGLPCSANSLSIVTEPTSDDEVGGLKDALIGAIRVYAAGGTSDVRNELNKAGVYALGVVSGENDQTGQFWRWLRVDGAPTGENAVPGTAGNTNAIWQKNGFSSFYFEATYTGGNATNDGYWNTIATAFGGLVAPVGLVNQATLDLGYTKGGLTCLGSSSN